MQIKFSALTFVFIILFISCAKQPERTDAENVLNSIDELKASRCGNGIVEEWEECDFEGERSCGQLYFKLIGPYKCDNCGINVSECIDTDICNATICTNNSVCDEDSKHSIYCKCTKGYSGKNCDECINGYHHDFDDRCIYDDICTEIGCELENQECYIENGSAECRCNEPWIGEKCDECSFTHYKENGVCKSRYCSDAEFACKYYEVCNDSSGKPVCVCAGKNQNPDNCSKCLPGYCWNDEYYDAKYVNEKFCLAKKQIECTHDPAAPADSVDIVKSFTIECIEGYWTSSENLCEWECADGSDACIQPLIKSFAFNDYSQLIGLKDNSILIRAGSTIYSFKKGEKTVFAEIPELTDDSYDITQGAIVGNDGNIYFAGKKSVLGIYFPEKRSFIRTQINTNSWFPGYNMSLIPNGVSFGNSYLNFPDINFYGGDTSITDNLSRILSVGENGELSQHNEYFNDLWSKAFENYTFSQYPAIDKQGVAYLPFKNETDSELGILLVDLEDGEVIEKIFSRPYNNYYPPAISIGNDQKRYILFQGNLTILDKTNNLIADTSLSSVNSTFDKPPVLTDDGLIYMFSEKMVFCVSEDGHIVWRQNLGHNIKDIIYYDHALYVLHNIGLNIYDAPGNLSGDWPQMKHDAKLSNSLLENEFIDPPAPPVPTIPHNKAWLDVSYVDFEWKTDGENNEKQYFLLLRDLTGLDIIYTSEYTGDNVAGIKIHLKKGSYEWCVVSKDENGSLNASEKRTFFVNLP